MVRHRIIIMSSNPPQITAFRGSYTNRLLTLLLDLSIYLVARGLDHMISIGIKDPKHPIFILDVRASAHRSSSPVLCHHTQLSVSSDISAEICVVSFRHVRIGLHWYLLYAVGPLDHRTRNAVVDPMEHVRKQPYTRPCSMHALPLPAT